MLGVAEGLIWRFSIADTKWIPWQTLNEVNYPRLPYWEKIGDVMHTLEKKEE